MLQQEPEEIFAFKGAIACFAGRAFHVLKSDAAVVIGEDTIFTDNAPVQIAGQVFEGGQAFSDMGAMDNPFSRCGFGDVKPFFVQGLEESCAKHLGQSEGIEEVLCFFLSPLPSGLVETASGHEHMNMGVIIQAPVMSVEDCSHADMGAEVFGVHGKVLQGGGNTSKHQVVNKRLMIPGEDSECIGESEGYQEVLDR